MTKLSPWAFVLAVPDLGRTAGCFRDGLGFRIGWDEAPDWRLAERDGVRVMLGLCPNDAPASEIGSHSWFGYVEVDDIGALHGELSGRDADGTAPRDLPHGMREIVVTTIDGHRIVFGQNTPKH